MSVSWCVVGAAVASEFVVPDSFRDLRVLEHEGAHLGYPATMTPVPRGPPPGGEAVVPLVRGPMAPGGPAVEIGFTWGPSDDPAFVLSRVDGAPLEVPDLHGTRLFVTPTAIYLGGVANRCFDERRKFVVADGRVTEVAQPFLAVGIDTPLTAPARLTTEPGAGLEVATVKAGASVHVLVARPDGRTVDGCPVHYLVRTSFGLVGWVAQTDGYAAPSPLAAIRFHGD